jgi:hypothetical protein
MQNDEKMIPTCLEVEVNVEQVVSRALRQFLDFVSKTKGATLK